MKKITSIARNKHLNISCSQLKQKSIKLKLNAPCPRQEGVWV